MSPLESPALYLGTAILAILAVRALALWASSRRYR